MTIGSRRKQPKGLPAIVAVLSLAVHGAAGALIHFTGDEPTSRAERVAAATEAELAAAAAAELSSPNCPTNASLAAWAQAAYCMSPLGGEACFAELDRSYNVWLSECNALFVEEEERKKRDKTPVRIAFLDAAALDKLEPLPIQPLLKPEPPRPEPPKPEIAQPAPPKPAAPPPPPPPPMKRRDRQVVEITPPENNEPPKDTRFISDFNSSTDKQRVARGSTEEMVDRPAPKELPVASKQKLPREPQPPKVLAKKQPESDFDNPRGTGKLDMRKPGERDETRRSKPKSIGRATGSKDPLTANGLAPRKGERGRKIRRPKNPRVGGEGGQEGERGRPKVPDLRPSEELLSRVVGGGSVDHLEEIEEGETTALNSKRWKYASFFNRLKRQVAQNWRPAEVYQARDPKGNVYGIKNRTTVVRVSLRKNGSVADIHVVKRSGVDFLDDEAVRAFRAAGPFPNPPEALADARDMISFSFSFVLEMSGTRSRWKFFRNR